MRYDCSLVRSEKLFFRFFGTVFFFLPGRYDLFSFFIFSHPFDTLLLFLLTVFRCSRSHPHVEEFCEHAHEEVKSRGKQGGDSTIILFAFLYHSRNIIIPFLRVFEGTGASFLLERLRMANRFSFFCQRRL